MGVSLSDIVRPREVEIEFLLDKRIAVDAFNWLYQFLSIIRQKDGEPLMDFSGRITSHLSGLFYRTTKLLENNIKPIYVFDGEKPSFKQEEVTKRSEIREEAKRRWQEALEKGDVEEARKYAQASSHLTSEMIEESKELLKALGVPVIQAPSEGEAQCAFMAVKGDVFAVASQDYDSLLFGAPRIVRNLSISGRRKRGESYITINPELVVLKDLLQTLNITREQLIVLGMLIGTDYNPGIKGIGPKKALDIVKMENIELILDSYEWNIDNIWEIYNFFLQPPVGNYHIEFGRINKEAVKDILCERHDFSEERVESALKKLEKKPSQRSLSSWA